MTKLTLAQVAEIHKARAHGVQREVLAKQYGVTGQAIGYWKRYAGMDAQTITWVKGLEIENRRLERLRKRLERQQFVASCVIKEFVPSARKRSVMSPSLQTMFKLDRVSANAVLGLSAQCGVPKVTQRDDSNLIDAMRQHIRANPGHGFSLIFQMLLKHQPGTRHHALQVYNEQKLHIKHRSTRTPVPRRVSRPKPIPSRADMTWSMDFLAHALGSGERFWAVCIVDNFNREAIAIKVARRRSSKLAIEALEEIVREGRTPKSIRTDNGSEFKSQSYKDWTKRRKVTRKYSRIYCATDNIFVERFNRTLRDEVFNHYVFRSFVEAQRMVDDWRVRYNTSRPHQSLGGLSPLEYAQIAKIRKRIHP